MSFSRLPFLTADWREIAMLNFEIDPAKLASRVPAGCELDEWQGRTLLSVVGFMFENTRLRGVPLLFHQRFEEVNLRFYVRRRAPDGWRRGVVFVKEIVPRIAIARAARALYNEPYVRLPMSHRHHSDGSSSSVCYAWRFRGREHSMRLSASGNASFAREGSEEQFIAEHAWGYTRQRDGSTKEYLVEHPPWRIRRAREASLDCDVRELYGAEFEAALLRAPSSAFLADGSPVRVHLGVRIQ